ncbi:MAG: hypothetical protein ABI854_02880 [Betaproteobacteria bacterium]
MKATRIIELLSHSAALFALCAMAGTFATAAPGPLDGKAFIGEAGEKGKPADEKNDVISFADGRFHSSACDQYGFNKGEYSAKAEGDATVFEAETTSEKEGRMKWKGVLKNGVLEGSFVHYRKPAWYRPNPEPIEHWFKAAPKS